MVNRIARVAVYVTMAIMVATAHVSRQIARTEEPLHVTENVHANQDFRESFASVLSIAAMDMVPPIAWANAPAMKDTKAPIASLLNARIIVMKEESVITEHVSVTRDSRDQRVNV
jgi:hypothetical protein